MFIPKGILGKSRLCLFSLGIMISALAGQESPSESQGSPKDSKTTPKKSDPPAEFKGQAKVSVHPFKMQKGDAYRITVKGDGFNPQVRIEGRGNNGYNANPTGAPTLNPLTNLLDPNALPGTRREAQIIFMPPETKVYQIGVDFASGTEIGKGPHAYTIKIERAAFKPQATFKEPQLGMGDDSKKLEQGKVYGITVIGKGFAPEVQILDGTRSVLTSMNGRWFGFGPDAEFINTATFVPTKTANYRILVALGPTTDKRIAPPKYTTTILELKMELSVKGQLTNKDPVYTGRGGRHKVHSVLLQADKTYQIDMISTFFDSYLFLEDGTGKVLQQDDDGGGYPNARIIFRPTRTDTYRIIATTFEPADPNRSPGAYTVTVIENPNAQLVYNQPSTFKKFPKFKK
jgi:hypothetical protein